jgi:hypothetical protein
MSDREAIRALIIQCHDPDFTPANVYSADELNAMSAALSDKSGDTPAHKWENDPHGDRYNCKRSDLPYGHLTDDEFANEFYLCNHRTSLDSAGYLSAAKDRIRWLSRQLEQSQPPATPETVDVQCSGCDGRTIHHVCGKKPDARQTVDVEALKRECITEACPIGDPECSSCDFAAGGEAVFDLITTNYHLTKKGA